jgi:hypothetical protein
MSNFVNISTKLHKNRDAEIMRLRAMVSSVRQQLDYIDTVIAAMLEPNENAARYQRDRAICSNRASTRAYLEGKE